MSHTYTPPEFTIGIEEEYLLVDLASRQLAVDPPEALFNACAKALPNQVTHEFLRAQIEIGTPVCDSIGVAREHLLRSRNQLSELAASYGLGIIAASTHPFAHWYEQTHTPLERYDNLAEDLQGVARRLLTCGMHVHIGIADSDLRIDLMNQVSYFLPHLLALSTSSPFWGGEDTGLNSYRLSVFNELPRTGLPHRFTSAADYERHVRTLVESGVIKDASMIWWDIRPSLRYPTLEMRITDVCTRLDDAATLAALYLATLHMLYRLRLRNQRWREYSPMLIQENRWRAQRYGIDRGLIDFGQSRIVGFPTLVDEWLELIAEDAQALGCEREVRQATAIVQRGTSAHHQRTAYQTALAKGHTPRESLKSVVDGLLATTIEG